MPKMGHDIFPVKAADTRYISEIERDADETQQYKVGEANGTRDHDRRICRAHLLIGDSERSLRQPTAPLDGRAIRRGGCRGRCGGV